MPGLLRGVARTAVVAGTATAVSGRVQRRQAEKYAGRDAQIYADRQQAYAETQAPQQAPQQVVYQQAPPPPPPTDSGDPTIEKLKELASLRDQGILTDEEFAQQKARVLAG